MVKKRIVVTGAGGFIGHHLVERLKSDGHWVRGVDIKKPEFGTTSANEFLQLDLRNGANCAEACSGMDEVFALAADMGGMGFISSNHGQILFNNAMITLQTIEAARAAGVSKLLYSSSACVYPEYRQTEVDIAPLKEADAYPAQPQDAYGWEKLFGEKACEYYHDQYGLDVRVVRFHNIFGPLGTWQGGREKVPAAFCRKVARAKLLREKVIEVWGDGEQTRSFCYIDDCIEGLLRLMASDWRAPLNLGQDRMVTVNELADIVAAIAGIEIEKKHIPGPQGVRGRNSDNTLLNEVLGWAPQISLEEGLRRTYEWIEAEVATQLALTLS